MEDHSPGVALRSIIIGLTAFLTVVDLFATQAILPSLARHYQVAPAATGFAVNATTMGMAVAGLIVGFFSPHIDRRLGILISLTVLAIPTSLLALAPNLTIFTLLRIAQGLCMASAFALTLAFIGTFTYVNFVLVRAPLSLGMIDLGLVYFVFLPSIVTTLLAGRAVARFGTRPAIWGALAVATIGLPLMLSPHLSEVVFGMVLVGIGTFFAQAAATGFVGQAAQENRGVASGTYLACYFAGGLVGSAILGQLFDRYGWTSCVVGIGIALISAALLTVRLTLRRDDVA
jgi:predicted MFS family arabinose efflux permease